MRTWLICALLWFCVAAAPDHPVDRGRYAETWNDIEAAVGRVNEARVELGDNVRQSPPWLVVSQPKQERRRQLYETTARDLELMARRYRQLRDLDQ